MSTVLKNGIIIPDNGNRNWGGDLANNWNIIDVNVGYMNDVKNKVTTLENSVAENTANIQTNASNISALQTSKQDTIEDLETIRTGASSGATAVQPSALNNYYTKAEVDTNLSSKANDSAVVHKSGDTMSGDLLGVGSNNLGTSTNKWKTINGINPGALSLPRGADRIEISIPQGASTYTPPVDGWFQVSAKGINFSLANGLGMISRFFYYPLGELTYEEFASFIPCCGGVECSIYVDTATTAYFIPCQGNV